MTESNPSSGFFLGVHFLVAIATKLTHQGCLRRPIPSARRDLRWEREDAGISVQRFETHREIRTLRRPQRDVRHAPRIEQVEQLRHLRADAGRIERLTESVERRCPSDCRGKAECRREHSRKQDYRPRTETGLSGEVSPSLHRTRKPRRSSRESCTIVVDVHDRAETGRRRFRVGH